MKNYTVTHLHDTTSNCNGYSDSCTSYKDYIKLAKKQNMRAIAFTNHGGIYDWIRKKQDCDKAKIKYIHGIELYVCTELEENERGYHICLYAKNYDGVLELNELYSLSTSKGKRDDKTDRHFYFNPRISLSELMNTSDNIIITTACFNSMLWKKTVESKEVFMNEEISNEEKISISEKALEYRNKMLMFMSKNKYRCFLEIQYHNHKYQIEYNQLLLEWSKLYKIPLIAGTDTHSSNDYKAECRKILQKSKNSYYGDEDAFDLTWKTYEELISAFKNQNSIPENYWMDAINNTNVLSDMVEDFKLDKSFKYPNLYGENASIIFKETILKKYNEKIKNNTIDESNPKYKIQLNEEFKIFKKQGMESFMLFMSELCDWCKDNDIPYGFCRGSVGGSLVAYILDIIDLDPVIWNTVFSRFVNADRISLGDIDIDFAPKDRDKVYQYIIKRIGNKNTAYIAQFGTLQDRGTIDVLTKGLDYADLDEVAIIKDEFEKIYLEYCGIIQAEVNLEELDLDTSTIDFDNNKIYLNQIRNKNAFKKADELYNSFQDLKATNKDLFYYFEGLKGTIISKGNHPSGIIGSPIALQNNLGIYYKDGDENIPISVCAMKAVDSVNFTKFDILGLKTIGILKDTYKYISSHYLKSHEINWNDKNVWDDMIKSRIGVFQFEGDFAFSLLKKLSPVKIKDMSLANASLRPSGKSYRDRLIAREFNKNPSSEIDELLKDNNGFLVYQEDTIKFLTDICGFDGALADTTRRAIGKKDIELLNAQLPKILEGYCKVSKQPREIAEEEVKAFIQIISDSSEYQFGYNHSTGYSMNGYACVRLRTYYPLEFITAYLNNADNKEDIIMGTQLAKERNIKINSPKFRYSRSNYSFNKTTNSVYKGMESIKEISKKCSEELYELRNNKYDTFIDLLRDIKNTSLNSLQLTILIKLEFFSEFGGSQYLLDVVEVFNKYATAKTLTKSKLDEKTMAIVSKYCTETNKQLKILDNIGIMDELIKNLDKDKNIILFDRLKSEAEFYGYITYINPEMDEDIYFVSEITKKFTHPQIYLYNISSGENINIKCKIKTFNANKFAVGDIIKVYDVRDENKWRKTSEGFEMLQEKEPILKSYSIIQI